MISSFLSKACIFMIKTYQYTFSLLLGKCCRFTPTCSEYAIDAYRAHGPLYASWLTFKRVLRCNPWGGEGYDPVPQKNKEL